MADRWLPKRFLSILFHCMYVRVPLFLLDRKYSILQKRNGIIWRYAFIPELMENLCCMKMKTIIITMRKVSIQPLSLLGMMQTGR